MRLYLDVGHGGKDSGAAVEGTMEKDLNLTFGLELHDALREEGHEVVMSRTSDKFIELDKRSYEANGELADLFISIHCNKHSSSASGTEVWHCDGSSKGEEIAKKMIHCIKSSTYRKNRGIKPTRKLTVLNKTLMPAVLVELGFMSNSTELKLLKDKGYRYLLIEGIVNTLMYL